MQAMSKMRRCASFMATRRISWIDQRIRNAASAEAAVAVFWALGQYWSGDG
jgi:hypothetical protein